MIAQRGHPITNSLARVRTINYISKRVDRHVLIVYVSAVTNAAVCSMWSKYLNVTIPEIMMTYIPFNAKVTQVLVLVSIKLTHNITVYNIEAEEVAVVVVSMRSIRR